MIPAIALVPICLGLASYTSYLYKSTSYIRRFKEDFQNVMESIGIENKNHETFQVIDINTKSYGLEVKLNIPDGLSQEHLNSKLNILQDNFSAIVELEKDRFQNFITMYLITKDIAKYRFKPVKAKGYQLYIGKDYKGQDYFIDLNKDSQLLIAGCTGTGKSFLLASILTNLIYNSSKDIEIYLSQIVKGDIGAFAKCKPVKFVANTVEEVNISLDKVCKILDNRSDLFTVYGIKNITQFNNHYPHRKLKRIFYVIEELSFFMEEGNEEIWNKILKISKAGRSVGISLVTAIQRTTVTNMDSNVKSQMTRITFRQKSSIDSINVIGISDATELKERECLVDSNNGVVSIKVPYIDEDYKILNYYVPEISVPEIKPKKAKNNKVLLLVAPKKQPVKEDNKVIDVEFKEETSTNPKSKKARKGVISLDDIEGDI